MVLWQLHKTDKQSTKESQSTSVLDMLSTPRKTLKNWGYYFYRGKSTNSTQNTTFNPHLGKVAVLGAGPCHLGGLCGVHREPTVVIVVNAPHVIRARQLIFFVGHAGVTGTAYIWRSTVQLGAHLHLRTTLPLARRHPLRCARTACSVMHLESAERENRDGADAKRACCFEET